MKLRIHSVAVLLAAALLPAALFAQAPTGVARVDSETYFETAEASWGYGNHQSSFAEYTGEPTASWPELESYSSDHAGLLGKTYVRGAYLYNGVDSTATFDADSAFDGWDVELNVPIPWISSDDIGSDIFVKHENRSFSATNRSPVVQFEVEGEFTVIGARFFAFPKSPIRPYITLGAGLIRTTTSGGGITVDDDDDGFVTNLGVEADLASNASIRGDFEIDRDEIDESTFEGTIVLWLGENIFVRGGGVIPLVDGFDPGVTIGGGLAFR